MKDRPRFGSVSPKSPPVSDLRVVVQRVLRGLADLMIDADLSMQEFEDIAKRAYVSVASSRAARGNGTVNLSQVAAITGLNRAEVKTLFNGARPATQAVQKSRAARVVDGWTTDPLFATRTGSPRILQLGEGPQSFSELVRRYAGDIPPRAILDRLERLGLVTVTLNRARARGRVQLLQKAPSNALSPLVDSVTAHLANTLRNPKESPLTTVCSVRLPAADAPTLAAIARAAIERRDAFLSGLVSSFPASSECQPSLEVFVSIAPLTDVPSESQPQLPKGNRKNVRKKTKR